MSSTILSGALSAKDANLAKKESTLKVKEDELVGLTQSLKRKEEKLQAKINEVIMHAQGLADKEQKLNAKERSLEEKCAELNPKKKVFNLFSREKIIEKEVA